MDRTYLGFSIHLISSFCIKSFKENTQMAPIQQTKENLLTAISVIAIEICLIPQQRR